MQVQFSDNNVQEVASLNNRKHSVTIKTENNQLFEFQHDSPIRQQADTKSWSNLPSNIQQLQQQSIQKDENLQSNIKASSTNREQQQPDNPLMQLISQVKQIKEQRKTNDNSDDINLENSITKSIPRENNNSGESEKQKPRSNQDMIKAIESNPIKDKIQSRIKRKMLGSINSNVSNISNIDNGGSGSQITLNQDLQKQTKAQGRRLKEKINEDCIYCLRRHITVLQLECGHKFCAFCLEMQHNITMIMPENKGILNRLVRCYSCKSQHKLSAEEAFQIRSHIRDKRVTQPIPQPPLVRGYKKCETCYKVTQRLDMLSNAEFECLSCNFLLCGDCLNIHFQNPQNEDHRVLKLLDNGNLERTENDFCEHHRECDFEVMFKLLEKKYSELYQKIERAFQNSLKESDIVQQGFNSMQQRLTYLQAVNPQRDVDILMINKLSDDILSMDVDMKFFYDFDISDSVFVNNPMNRMEIVMTDYDFRDVSSRQLKNLRYCFVDSKILDGPMHITNELYIMFPRIKSSELIYRMGRDGISPEIFHKRCDNKGATMMIIKTQQGHIFGGYNPSSWVSQYCYSDCDDAFLFSIFTPGAKRPPFKCPVKKDKQEFAIKNAEAGFSPGFGEANNCDLFIAFKNPSKSYSKLGTVYQPPFQYSHLPLFEIHSLLAGTPTNWEISEIEIYSVKIQDNLEI
ncbi:b-box zinc finger family protein [Stylonychia lemnae]|uniref:B-box zinc finger family protein n=1 Tax=Stylonychia lemnae TaxID=5949 RepID=A0A077ZQW6_STYLE|nr:b-box zinc finger family protein [Stylonychia lemnae]|eukprot:CDW72297.1 b-box zinc finger family protein [Stylonychia lemnae]